MATLVLSGDPAVNVSLRRNASARRLSLRVSAIDGQVILSLPRWSSTSAAMQFVREKEGWIRRQLACRTGEIIPQIGGHVMLGGRAVAVVATDLRVVQYSAGKIMVPGDALRVPVRVGAFLKVLARQHLGDACDRHAAALGVDYGRISLRDTRTRWGSCTAQGNLMFSWRLVMAPARVLDYVAAHEVAHRVEMNHSRAYWDVVERVFADYGEPRAWLRDNGHRLHAYRFGALTAHDLRDHGAPC